ncbi:MAG TPA: YcnI family protein [Microbacteriaceae bacterium]|nr:YcnI family protein [Microbacteriaceae bacterium]
MGGTPGRVTRLAAAMVAGLALALAGPLSASAHVRVSPDTATPGGYALLTFRVPTESATASTVRLEVDLPKDTPFSSVSYEPVAGWATSVTTSTLATPVKTKNATITEAATKVVWTATSKAARIAPGQFRQFTISAGPVPETGKVVLPAHQTYSDGTVVDWAEPTPASGVEPQHPAPTVYITDAPPGDVSSAAGAPTVTATPRADGASALDVAAGRNTTVDAVALGSGIGGLALGAIALVVALAGLAHRRAGTGRP